METTLDAVVVYPDRALVARIGRQAVEAGRQELVVANLPVGLFPEWVRVRARGTAPVRLLGTEVGRTFHTDPVEEKPAEIVAEIEALEEQDAGLAQRQEAVGVRRTFLQRLVETGGEQIARGLALGRTGMEAGGALDEFVAGKLQELAAEVGEVRLERRALHKSLEAARARLKQFQHQRPTERTQVTILVQAQAACELEIELRYQVVGASWEPLYDLRFTEGSRGAQLELACLAELTQQTGEPWENVALTLSTARPALGAVLPELEPWYLHPPAPPMGGMAMRARMAAPAAAAAPPLDLLTQAGGSAEEAFGAEPTWEEAVHEEAVVETTGAAITFSVTGRTGIPDDGSPHKVALTASDLPARFDLITAPKLTPHAYR
ncbi:MAG: mucoidy inhibitor MuiA family protein, partial [Armatimonadetes bacterium]|nr:mucoidy inhibitor MuiA family protein [Armatimonadota bacterium]